MVVEWPTHRAKTRKRQAIKLWKKSHGRKIRRLARDGKRGDVS